MNKVKVIGGDGKTMYTVEPVNVEPIDTGEPMSDVIVFPAVEQANDLNRDFYLGGKNPWNTACRIEAATADCYIDFEPVPAGVLTMPFDGDYQMRKHQEALEMLEDGASAAEALAHIVCTYDPQSSGVLCNPSVGASFYIARRPLTDAPTAAGQLYATSVIRPQADDGKRGFVYRTMAENGSGSGIRWQINLDLPRP